MIAHLMRWLTLLHAKLDSVNLRRDPKNWRTTYRAMTGVVLSVLLIAISIIFVGDIVLRGAWRDLWQFTPWILLVNWIVWGLFVRPSLRVDAKQVVVINPIFMWRISWSRVARINGARLLTFELDDGTFVTSWGAPAGPRQRDLLTKDVRDGTARSIVSTLNQHRIAAPHGQQGTAARYVDWWCIAPGVMIMALCVLTITLR